MMKGGRNPSELADEGPCKKSASGLSASVPVPYLERTAGPPGGAEEVAITGSSAPSERLDSDEDGTSGQ